MIYVIASLELQAGKRDAYLKEFCKIESTVHKEKGCIAYAATVDKRTDIDIQVPYRANTVTIMEQWESMEALGAHLATPHMGKFFAATNLLVTKRELQILDPA